MRRLSLCLALIALVVVVLADRAAAQIPPRATLAKASAAARVLVGTPEIEGDRAAAVAIGHGLRGRLAQVAGSRYQVVSRDAMNNVLTQSGYEADQALDPTTLAALAAQFKASLVVSSRVGAAADGRLSVTVSMGRPDGSDTSTEELVQAEGQSAEAFGAALADRLKSHLN